MKFEIIKIRCYTCLLMKYISISDKKWNVSYNLSWCLWINILNCCRRNEYRWHEEQKILLVINVSVNCEILLTIKSEIIEMTLIMSNKFFFPKSLERKRILFLFYLLPQHKIFVGHLKQYVVCHHLGQYWQNILS